MRFNKLSLMFGNLFGKKKQERSYSDLTIYNLKKKDLLDYFMKSWLVEEITFYDWGNNDISKELLLNSGDDKCYLSLDSENNGDCTISRSIELKNIEPDVREHFRTSSEAMSSITVEGKEYKLTEEAQGHLASEEKSTEDNNWTPFVNFDYYDADEKEFISIVQLNEQHFEAYKGNTVKDYEFSNLIPSE